MAPLRAVIVNPGFKERTKLAKGSADGFVKVIVASPEICSPLCSAYQGNCRLSGREGVQPDGCVAVAQYELSKQPAEQSDTAAVQGRRCVVAAGECRGGAGAVSERFRFTDSS